MKNLRKGFVGAVLTLAFVFGISIAASSTAQAQYRNDDRYERRDGRNGDWVQGRDGRWYRVDRNRRNRRNDVYTNNGRYGRNDGYDNGNYGYGNGGYNTNNNAYQIALQQGYQQGLNTGASDGQRRQSYNPQRSKHWKNASSQAYREGFVRGYDQGYRQYAGYDNGDYNRRSSGSGLGQILGAILGGRP